MARTPVDADRPDCFSMNLGGGDCRSCRTKKTCRTTYKYLSELRTVEDVLFEMEEKAANPAPIGIKEALSFLVREFTSIGGSLTLYNAHHSEKWRASMRRLVNACLAARIDPRLYIRSQVQTIGCWTIKKHKFLYPNMLAGPKAQSRFEEWLEKNHRQYGDHHYLHREGEGDVTVAESLFIEQYVNGTGRVRKVEAFVKKRFPKWSLKLGRCKPIIRVRAIYDYLVGINITLPRRVCLHQEELKYGAVKREILSLLR